MATEKQRCKNKKKAPGRDRVERNREDDAWTEQFLTGDPANFDADQRLLQRIFETSQMLLDTRRALLNNTLAAGQISRVTHATELAKLMEVYNMIESVRRGHRHPVFRFGQSRLRTVGRVSDSLQVAALYCHMAAFTKVWVEVHGKTQKAARNLILGLYGPLGLTERSHLHSKPSESTLKAKYIEYTAKTDNGHYDMMLAIAGKYASAETEQECYFAFAFDFAQMHSFEAVGRLHLIFSQHAKAQAALGE